ncbi:MAG: hypothetical protein QM669_12355 [Siphonobacter sp.]
MVTAVVAIASLAWSIYSGIKGNQAAKEAGDEAVQAKATENLLAKYRAEIEEADLEAKQKEEEKQVKAEALARKEQFQKYTVWGLITFSFVVVFMVIKPKR